MIARIWRCTAAADKAPLYLEHFERRVLLDLRKLDGFRGASILRRALGNSIVELTVQTVWESMEAIRSFAGNDVDQAVVSPDAKAVLLTFDSTVQHCEIVLSVSLES